MSDVAAYHVFVCALFLVQGGMWTAVIPYYSRLSYGLLIQDDGVREYTDDEDYLGLRGSM